METTDVIICGCGPTGAMLSGLLGKYGVRNVVLEKETAITTDPRGIALDEDGIRSLQGLGLYQDIYSKIGICMGYFNFISGVHSDLTREPFMKINYNTTEGGTGHVGFICHKQPALEASIRSVLDKRAASELRPGCTVTDIKEDHDWVYVEYVDQDGNQASLKAKFLVGADGKTGFTRKQYLERRGIQMEKVSKTSYEETWVALNWKLRLPTPETHPEFPLWKLGYNPENVYDLFFPEDFRFLCNPSRPAVCGRFGLASDMLWRFEFVVKQGENPDEMAQPHKIKEIVHPYITHSGSRYGLPGTVAFPQDCITVLRSRPFRFSARSCNQWSKDRVILCGDAAHVFPPFGGQGIASGFRDAYALAWRLAILTRPSSGPYRQLLEGWCTERKQQLEKSLASTVENGRFVTESSGLKALLRDWVLTFLRLFPAAKRFLEKGPRKDGMFRYRHRPNVAFLPQSGGFTLPQVYCVNLGLGTVDKSVEFTDDVIFGKDKQKLFQVVVLLKSADQYAQARDDLANVDELSRGELLASEATFIVHDSRSLLGDTKGLENMYRVATAQEFAASTELCGRRPAPEYYDEFQMMREAKGMRFLIVRPDWVVYAACKSAVELERSVVALSELANST